MSARLNEFIEHARSVVNFTLNGHCTEAEAVERIKAYLDADTVKREALRRDHFVIPERMSWDGFTEVPFLGTPGSEYLAHDRARARLGVAEYERLVPEGQRRYPPKVKGRS